MGIIFEVRATAGDARLRTHLQYVPLDMELTLKVKTTAGDVHLDDGDFGIHFLACAVCEFRRENKKGEYNFGCCVIFTS